MARDNIGQLWIDISADPSKAEQSIKQLKTTLERAGQDGGKSFSQAMDTHMGRARQSVNLMEQAWVKATAAIWAAKQALEMIAAPWQKLYMAVEEYNMAVTSMGALAMTMMDKTGKTPEQAFKAAKGYAADLVEKLEEIDAKTIATGTDLMSMTQEMAKQGVFLDANNEKAVQGFTNLANAVAVVSAGAPNREIQIRQEIRAAIQGQTRETDQLGKILKSVVDGPLEQEIQKHKQAGDLLEWLGEKLSAYAAFSKDIEGTWAAIGTTLETVGKKIARLGFTDAYKEINQVLQDLVKWLGDNRLAISAEVKSGWGIVRDIAKEIWELLGRFGPQMKQFYLEVKGTLLLFIAFLDLVNQIFARIGDTARMMKSMGQGDFANAAKIFMNPSREFKAGQYVGMAMDAYSGKMAPLGEPGPFRKTITAEREPLKFKTPPGDDKKSKVDALNKKLTEDIAKQEMSVTDFIEWQAAEYRKAGANRVLVESWVASETKKAWADYEKYLKERTENIYTDQMELYMAVVEKRNAMAVEQGIKSEVDALAEKYAILKKINEVELANATAALGAAKNPNDITAALKRIDTLTSKGQALNVMEPVEKEAARWKEYKDGMETAKEYARDYTLFREQQLDILANKMRRANIDEVDIARWRRDQLKKIAIDQAQFEMETADTAEKATAAAFKKEVLEAKTTAQTIAEFNIGAVNQAQQTLGDSFYAIAQGNVRGLEAIFYNFFNSLERMLADWLAQWLMSMAKAQMAAQMATAAAGGGGSWMSAIPIIGPMLTGGGGATAATEAFQANELMTWAPVGHKGILPGGLGASYRYVPNSMFDTAPRYHQGKLGPREMPAIIKDDEYVIPADKMGGGEVYSPTIHMNVQTMDGRSFLAFAMANRKVLGDVLIAARKENHPVRR